MSPFRMFRSARRAIFLVVILAVVLPQIGGVGTITGSIGNVVDRAAGVLGVTGLVDAIGDAFTGVGEGKTKKSSAVVVHSVDGDTFDVQLKSGKEVSIRILGIDTPESHRPGVAQELCSLDAAAAGKALSEGKAVKLTTDPTQDTIDQYGRWLRYAKIDGKDYGLTMLKKGWAAPYVYDDNPVKKIDAYRKAAEYASSKSRGVWGKCGGNFHSEGDEPWSGD